MDNTPNALVENFFQKMRNILKKKEFIYIYVWKICLAHEWKFVSKHAWEILSQKMRILKHMYRRFCFERCASFLNFLTLPWNMIVPKS